MPLTASQFITGAAIRLQELVSALAEGDFGLFLMHVWPQVAALGLFAMGVAAGQRVWKRDRVEARIAGLDFTAPENVQAVCEFTDKDGTPARARFGMACPSYATGHTSEVFVDWMNPGIVTTAAAQYPLFAGGLFFVSAAAFGAWQSYRLADSLGAWIASSLQEIALTEVAFLALVILLLPLVRATEDQYKANAEKLKKIELVPFEHLSEVDDRLGQFRRSLRSQRMASLGFILFAALAFYTAASDAVAYYNGKTVTAWVAAYAPAPGEALYRKPVSFPAIWTGPSGQPVWLKLNQPSGLLARKAYSPATEIPVRLDPEAAVAEAAAYKYAFAEVDCGPAVAVLEFFFNALGAAMLLSIGLCLRAPGD